MRVLPRARLALMSLAASSVLFSFAAVVASAEPPSGSASAVAAAGSPLVAAAPSAQAVAAFAKSVGISDTQASTDLSIQEQAGNVVQALQSALGADYAGVWFDNTAGRFKVPVMTSSDAPVVSTVFAALGLAQDVDTTQAQYTWDQLQCIRGSENATRALRAARNAAKTCRLLPLQRLRIAGARLLLATWPRTAAAAVTATAVAHGPMARAITLSASTSRELGAPTLTASTLLWRMQLPR